MEIVTAVINPVNNEEVEITLTANVAVTVTENGSVLNVHATGYKKLV
jgi:hypothetical protein